MTLIRWGLGRAAVLLLFSFGLGRAEVRLVIACAGDSLMRPVPLHLLAISPPRGWTLDIREWAQGGLSSETYPDFFRRGLPRWEGTRCDAILLQLGTNDAAPLVEGRSGGPAFEARIAAILEEFKRFEGPDGRRPVLLVATVPLFCDRPESAAKNRVVEDVINPALRAVAARAGAVVVDQFAVLKGRPELYDPDCVHPNGAGELALAESWFAALRSVFDPAGAGFNLRDDAAARRRRTPSPR
jgi:lysophospholipase L1-like esterase